MSTASLEESLRKCAQEGHIVPRTENNPYLKVSYKGAGKLVSDKWNVKIYTSGSVVCNDKQVLTDIERNKIAPPDEKKTIVRIDDAGWGFPMCGVMIGIECYGIVHTDTVDVRFFQGMKFEMRDYLHEYTEKGLRLLREALKASPHTHRIEICSGYINTELRKSLRGIGYDVRIVDITGPLQEQLEHLYKEHVRQTTGADVAYDPKALPQKRDVSRNYYEAVAYGKRNCPHLLKTGWKNL